MADLTRLLLSRFEIITLAAASEVTVAETLSISAHNCVHSFVVK